MNNNEEPQKEQSDADKLLESRRAVYGDRVDNMRRTAKIWSGLLGVDIQPWQVPLMMSAYKMFRAFGAPDYSDNIDDVDGWNQMFREQMEADGTPVIPARTVEEYLAKKFEVKEGQGSTEPNVFPTETTLRRFDFDEPVVFLGEAKDSKEGARHFQQIVLGSPIEIDQSEGRTMDSYQAKHRLSNTTRRRLRDRLRDSGIAGVQDD